MWSLNPEISADKIGWILSQIPGPVVPYLISFENGKAKANWARYVADIAHRYTFSNFWTLPRQHVRLGLFSTWTQTWVGKNTHEYLDWHCWAVAIVKDSIARRGVHMIIWDCDPLKIDDLRPHQFLLPLQRKLLNFAKSKGPVQTLWYNQDTTLSGHGRCLTYSLWWIDKVAAVGDVAMSAEDTRTKGCTLVRRK